MRRAYSAQACSAQPGSLAATATTWSRGTRALFLASHGAFQAYGLAAPDFFQVVEVAHRRMHDVYDHVAEVHQHPFAIRFALHAVHPRAVLTHFLLHVVGERLYLARGFAACNYHALEHGRHARGVVDEDIAALDVFERIDHHALLLADVHLLVEALVGNIVRHRGRHRVLQRLAARGARTDVARR